MNVYQKKELPKKRKIEINFSDILESSEKPAKIQNISAELDLKTLKRLKQDNSTSNFSNETKLNCDSLKKNDKKKFEILDVEEEIEEPSIIHFEVVKDVLGDGNCFYRCCSYHVYGTEERYQ